MRVPLCGDLARTTYETPTDGSEVSRYMRAVAADWNLNLIVISPFAMEVSGDIFAEKRFLKEYPLMVCGFDPKRVAVPHDTYLRCMDHVTTWIEIIQSQHPDNLFIEETEYEPVCASGKR